MKEENKVQELEIEFEIASTESSKSLYDVLKKYRKKLLYLCVSALISGFAWLLSRSLDGSNQRTD